MQAKWKSIEKRLGDVRERRNRFAHSSMRIEEDLGGVILVASKNPQAYPAKKLRKHTKEIDELRFDVDELAGCIIRVPFE